MIARAASIAAVLLVLLAPALGRRVEAQRAPIDATASVDVQSALLGERFRLAVTVTHPSDLLVSVEPPARSATLQLIEVVPAVRTPGTPTMTTRFEYVLAAFALGDVTLPAQRVSWLNAQGETGSLQVAAPPLPVRARSADDDTTLRPLKPQAEVGGAPLWWQRYGPYALGVAAASALLAHGAYRWSTRPRHVVVAMPEIAPVDEAARARLDVLAAGNPLARGDYDGYYGTIAEVVRDHLETHFGFNARALTTAELQQRMVALGVERWQARLVSGLLDRCDGAVYARRRPDPSSADHDLTMAYEIVELSREHETAVAG
ncbi:MAG: hypothetical protein WC211_01840 [Dehalococcoidia bacterium]